MLARFLENGYNLLTVHRRKPLEKILDGVAPLQVIKKAPYGDARAGKDQFTA